MSKAVAKLKRGDTFTSRTLHTNAHVGHPLFGPQQGFAHVSQAGNSDRAGEDYHVGLTADGRVVHLYTNGTRIVLPKPQPAPGVSEVPAGHHALLAALAAQYARELGQ